MKIIKNEKLIERNGKIGQWVSMAALLVLGLGMYISFTRPEWFSYSLVSLVAGFILTQIGMYMGNRWGRSPRPDEKIDSGLKGLHSDFNMYHYTTPVSHLLVGPAGVWVIIPYHQKGKAEYKKNRWRLSGGGFMQGYMRLFGQEGMGNPEAEALSEIDRLKKYFSRNNQGVEIPDIQAALVFTNDQLELNAGESPIPALKLKQLKELMRRHAREKPIGKTELESIKSVLPE
jgi:hypothetical protein